MDVEEWFHILDSPAAPTLDRWSGLEARAQSSVERILGLLEETGNKATFFWLGWMADRYPRLLRACQAGGHEIASHGYAHLLAYKAGPRAFREDIVRARKVLEDVSGERVRGFRAPGFGVTSQADWAFDVIAEAGYRYDSSVFPAPHGHGGLLDGPMEPCLLSTSSGSLAEIPIPVVKLLGRRVTLFGGGYLRLASPRLIRWGIRQVHAAGRPLVLYIHPREIDPTHPRLPLSPIRRFKCYVNLNTTWRKLEWLCKSYPFCTVQEIVSRIFARDNDPTGASAPLIDAGRSQQAT